MAVEDGSGASSASAGDWSAVKKAEMAFSSSTRSTKLRAESVRSVTGSGGAMTSSWARTRSETAAMTFSGSFGKYGSWAEPEREMVPDGGLDSDESVIVVGAPL